MNDDEALELGQRLTLLAEVLDAPMSPTRIAGYRALLDDLAFEDIAASLNALGKTSVFFPKPAEIREQAKLSRMLRVSREQSLWLKMHEADRPEALQAHDADHAQALLESPNPPEPYDERGPEVTRTIIAKLREMVKPMPKLPEVDQAALVRRQIAEWKRKADEDNHE